MKPDFLICRKKVMAILEIHSQPKFYELLKKGCIPPAWGQSKRTHLWSNALIHDINAKMLETGESFSKEMTDSLLIEALLRLAENRTAKSLFC